MNDVIFSILLVIVGLFVGAFIMILINKLKVSAAQKEAEKIRMNGYKLVKDEFNYERRLNAIWKLSGIDDLLKR